MAGRLQAQPCLGGDRSNHRSEPAATNVKAQPSDTTPPEAANTEAPEVVQPTPHQDLHASNPDEFELASGRVQLVELFAYW